MLEMKEMVEQSLNLVKNDKVSLETKESVVNEITKMSENHLKRRKMTTKSCETQENDDKVIRNNENNPRKHKNRTTSNTFKVTHISH